MFDKKEKAVKPLIHWQIPPETPYIQRPELETAIHERMKAEPIYADVTGELSLTVVVGIPGVGKTAALQAVIKPYLQSHHVFWFNAESKKLLLDQYRKLWKTESVQDFYLPNPHASISDKLLANVIKNYISDLSDPALIIFDHAEDWSAIKDFVPVSEKTRVLVSSNKRLSYSQKACIKVEGMKPREAVELVKSKIPTAETIETFVSELEFFPGLILQAISYIQTHKLDLKYYVTLLHKNPIEILDPSTIETLVQLLKNIEPSKKKHALNVLEIISSSDKPTLKAELYEKATMSECRCFEALGILIDHSFASYESVTEARFKRQQFTAYAIVKTLMRSPDILQRIWEEPLKTEEACVFVSAADGLSFFAVDSTNLRPSLTSSSGLPDPVEQKRGDRNVKL